MNLEWKRLRREAATIRRLVTVGAVITWAGAVCASHYLMHWDWRLAIVFGALVIVTGPTVVSPLLRRIRVNRNLQTILEAEGVFIDAIGAILAVVAFEFTYSNDSSFGSSLVHVGSRLAIGAGVGPDHHSAVMIDEYQAAYDMTEHIIRLGHKKVGFIIGNPHQTASALRLEGFQEAMAAHKLDVPQSYLAQGLFSYRSGLDAAMRLLSQPDPPSAIFASNDDMAAGTLMAAHEMGVSVPDQLSVAGFDDASIARTSWPPLTTISQPTYQLSYTAADLLLKSLLSGAPPKPLRLPHKLIRRSSTGVLKQSD